MTRPIRTHFVVADGARARWVARSEVGDLKTEQEIACHGEAAAAHVATAINAAVRAGHVERLVLAAPSRTLTEIEVHLDPAARALLAHTLAKDLTHVLDHDLARWLAPLELI